MNYRLLCSIVTSLLCFSSLAIADNWPQWRGPSGNGVSRETGLQHQWDQKTNIAWRFPLPGPAGASPVVWGQRIFLTSVDGDDLYLICVSTEGKKLWSAKIGEGNRNVRVNEGNSASPSPATDGKHVWATVTNGNVVCYSVEGQEVWKANLQDRYGRFNIAFGMTATPVLHKGKLYFQLIHGSQRTADEEALVVCLDAADGSEVWKRARITGATNENKHSYASPFVYRSSSREYLVTHGGDYAVAHELKDGKEIWRYCLNPKGEKYHKTLRFVSSPLATDGMIVIPSAKGGPVVCLRPGVKGDVSNDAQSYFWRHDRGTPDVPSPLYFDGLVYLNRENGNLICVDAKTGEKVYENRTTVDKHRASPIYADGKVYTTARNGVVTVTKAGREFKILAQNDLKEPVTASPAVSNGVIYIRSFNALYAIR